MNTFAESILSKISTAIKKLKEGRMSYLKLVSLLLAFLFISSMTFYTYDSQRLDLKDIDNLRTFGPREPNPYPLYPEFGPLDERIIVSQNVMKQKNRIKRKGKRYHNLVVQTANRHDIDPALIKAIIMAESGYNPKAQSRKGAKGLMQLMPQTAELLGVTDGFNPEENINGGVRYFKMLLKSFGGNTKLALAAYNAGSRYVKEYGGVPPFDATRIYIWKVFEYQKIYKDEMGSPSHSPLSS
ncbi:lytic transglycosylase domain-containing protein [Thermodesulfobacteriota bacterium]